MLVFFWIKCVGVLGLHGGDRGDEWYFMCTCTTSVRLCLCVNWDEPMRGPSPLGTNVFFFFFYFLYFSFL